MKYIKLFISKIFKLNKCRFFLFYGNRDYKKIKLSFIFANILLNKKKSNIINSFNNIKIITCGSNFNLSKKYLFNKKKILFTKSFNPDNNIIGIKQVKCILNRGNYHKKPMVYIVYCIENCSYYASNFLLKILDNDLLNYYIFIAFDLIKGNKILLSRLYKIGFNDLNINIVSKINNNFFNYLSYYLLNSNDIYGIFKKIYSLGSSFNDFFSYFFKYIFSSKLIIKNKILYYLRIEINKYSILNRFSINNFFLIVVAFNEKLSLSKI